LNKSTIFVVEDNLVDYDVLVDVLREINYEFIHPNKINNILELVRAKKPNLIILDVIFLGENGAGFGLCKQLKNDPEVKNIPILIISRRALDTDIKEGKDAGADDYLVKPYSPYELRQKVQELLKTLNS
jgi:DNA-binding response OmpR family regulator